MYVKKYINLKLNLGWAKVTIRRGLLAGTLSCLSSLNQLSSASLTSLHSGFQNHFILIPFCSNELIIFPIVWIIEFMRPNSWHMSNFFLSTLYLSYHFNFSFNAENLPFVCECSHLITLPVSCYLQEYKSRRQPCAQSKLPLLLSFFRPGVYVVTLYCRGFAHSRKRRWLISRNSLLLRKL